MNPTPNITLENPLTAPSAKVAGGRSRIFARRGRVAASRERIVVIGNGMAGHKFCQGIIAREPAGRFALEVFGEEKRPAYDRVRLSQFFNGTTPGELQLAAPEWYSRNQIKLHLGDPAVFLDRKNKRVRTAGGSEIAYDRLVFATGSRAWVPSIRGRDLPGVFVYRTLDDLEAIRDYSGGCSRAAVLGGGLLGLEAAKALADLGLKTYVIERGTGLLARQLDPAGSALLHEHIEAMGLKPMLQRETVSIDADGEERLLYFNTNEVLRVQLVIIAAGIRPRDELAVDSGLDIGPRGGVKIDDFLQTSDRSIYAIGECAAHRGVLCGLAGPSLQMADTLAANLCGPRRRYPGADFSTRLKLAGIEVATLGDFQEEGTTLVYQQEGSYRRLVLKRGRLVGAVGVGSWADAPRVQEAIDRKLVVWHWQADRFRQSGSLWKDPVPLPVARWPATALVCNCTGVRCGELVLARSQGCVTVEALAARTGATTVCGSCRPLLAELVGTETVHPRVRGSKVLLGVAVTAVVFVIAVVLLPGIPLADTVQGGWKPDFLWNVSFWKQVTGYSLVGVSLLSLLLSLRKRLRFFSWGDFGHWRALHAILGVLTLLLLVSHTGFRLGKNLNLVLMLDFLALALMGAMAGVVVALEQHLSGPSGRRLRAIWTGAHIAMTWPLPALVLFHALAAYYF